MVGNVTSFGTCNTFLSSKRQKVKRCYAHNQVMRMLDFLIKYICVLLIRGMIIFIQATGRVFLFKEIEAVYKS